MAYAKVYRWEGTWNTEKIEKRREWLDTEEKEKEERDKNGEVVGARSDGTMQAMWRQFLSSWPFSNQ